MVSRRCYIDGRQGITQLILVVKCFRSINEVFDASFYGGVHDYAAHGGDYKMPIYQDQMFAKSTQMKKESRGAIPFVPYSISLSRSS